MDRNRWDRGRVGMPGARSQSKWARYGGILAAAIGLIGYTVFGWRFGEYDGSVPFIVGLLVAFVAVAWTLYQRW